MSDTGCDAGDSVEGLQLARPLSTSAAEEQRRESARADMPLTTVCVLVPAEVLQQRADFLVAELAACQAREAGLRQELAGMLSMIGQMQPYYD